MGVPSIAVIVPTYGHFDYAAKAVRSALENTTSAVPTVIVVDDASPDWNSGKRVPLDEVLYDNQNAPERIAVHRFNENGGLTRSWNQGLRIARDLGLTYACAGNSDLIFPRGWDMALVGALDSCGVHLVGPCTNAPGSNPEQDVTKHFPKYQVTDDLEYLNKVSRHQIEGYGTEVKPTTLNGFCMVAKTATWWKHAYTPEDVFRPRNDTNSKGQPNPTPLMTLNEYELQARWHAAGLKTGYCPGSFVFHYRSVSRGDKYKQGNWYRMGA